MFVVFIEMVYAGQIKLRLLCVTKFFDVDPTRNYLSFRSIILISFTFRQPTLLLLTSQLPQQRGQQRGQHGRL